MSNHDVPRHASRYALPQIKTPSHHQVAKDWLLRDGTSYIEDRELGTKRSRAAIMMETGLPGSVYVYQGEELGLFEVADIPWDRLEDPTPYFTTQRYYEKGRDGCRVPMPWIAADKPTPASWNESFGDGASFGFSPSPRWMVPNPKAPICRSLSGTAISPPTAKHRIRIQCCRCIAQHSPHVRTYSPPRRIPPAL